MYFVMCNDSDKRCKKYSVIVYGESVRNDDGKPYALFGEFPRLGNATLCAKAFDESFGGCSVPYVIEVHSTKTLREFVAEQNIDKYISK